MEDMKDIPKISVIVPTYNRFKFLRNTLCSIQAQTYPSSHIEIIVINDGSTEKEYYLPEKDNVIWIHLPQNSKTLFGHACVGYVRNEGLKRATGRYIAFCDDDDVWLPNKLELQWKALQESGCKMCCTDGWIGYGEYQYHRRYTKMNAESHYIQAMYKGTGLLDNGFPHIWSKEFLLVNNCVITSSVLMEKELLDKIHHFRVDKFGQEDYDCWMRALEHTSCVYVPEVCFYYDKGHGYGTYIIV